LKDPALPGAVARDLDRPSPADVDDDARLVLVNFETSGVIVEVGRGRTVEIASDATGEGRTFQGVLGPDQALVLR